MDALQTVKGARLTPHAPVGRRQYFRELRQSALCFSPFGYGEVCWRDFEAIVHGAALVKPDMQHIETHPNAFVPFETYIPVRWDLADLPEKVAHYRARPDERRRIAETAFEVLSALQQGPPPGVIGIGLRTALPTADQAPLTVKTRLAWGSRP